MTKIIAVEEQLSVRRCPSCQMQYAAPTEFFERRLIEHNRGEKASWFCPAGHSIVYSDEPEIDRVRRERDRALQENARLAEQAHAARALAAKANKLAGEATTEVKRRTTRAAAGVCPCCDRTFSQLAAHMRTQHPGEAAKSYASKGGQARAAHLSAEERIAIAKKGAQARWEYALMIDADFNIEDVEAVVATIKPLMKGHAPAMQGAVIGVLLGIWLHGHQMADGLPNDELAGIRKDLCDHVATMAKAWCFMMDAETADAALGGGDADPPA